MKANLTATPEQEESKRDLDTRRAVRFSIVSHLGYS
jgi:hypothetical protein